MYLHLFGEMWLRCVLSAFFANSFSLLWSVASDASLDAVKSYSTPLQLQFGKFSFISSHGQGKYKHITVNRFSHKLAWRVLACAFLYTCVWRLDLIFALKLFPSILALKPFMSQDRLCAFDWCCKVLSLLAITAVCCVQWLPAVPPYSCWMSAHVLSSCF